MYACQVLQKILHPVTTWLDARNVRNHLFAVEALLAGRRADTDGTGPVEAKEGQVEVSPIPRTH